MSNFEKKIWYDESDVAHRIPISPDNLNRMENGIEEAILGNPKYGSLIITNSVEHINTASKPKAISLFHKDGTTYTFAEGASPWIVFNNDGIDILNGISITPQNISSCFDINNYSPYYFEYNADDTSKVSTEAYVSNNYHIHDSTAQTDLIPKYDILLSLDYGVSAHYSDVFKIYNKTHGYLVNINEKQSGTLNTDKVFMEGEAIQFKYIKDKSYYSYADSAYFKNIIVKSPILKQNQSISYIIFF